MKGDSDMDTGLPLRIAQVAPPSEPVPPSGYGGTERVIDELVRELVRRGHDVTLFASGDSRTAGRLVPTVPHALRPAGQDGDGVTEMIATVCRVAEEGAGFDVIHSHLEWWSVLLGRMLPVPVAATFHGRLDRQHATPVLAPLGGGLVAISRNQASVHPDLPWTVVHNGLTLDDAPCPGERSDEICFIGRLDAEKGALDALEVAQLSGRKVRIAAKIGPLSWQRQHYQEVFLPALRAAGSAAEFVGELAPQDRDRLISESHATIMPGAWPEPFGLVAIESLACGTPIVARRVGGLPEIIREGIDGYFGDDPAQLAFQLERVGDLDRTAIRASVVNRFSASRMADGYEALYRRLVADHRREPRRPEPAMTDGLPSLQPIGGGTRTLVRGGGGDGTDGELAIS